MSASVNLDKTYFEIFSNRFLNKNFQFFEKSDLGTKSNSQCDHENSRFSKSSMFRDQWNNMKSFVRSESQKLIKHIQNSLGFIYNIKQKVENFCSKTDSRKFSSNSYLGSQKTIPGIVLKSYQNDDV